MKKTLLVTIDFPPNLGGVANYYENICSNLPNDKIVVLCNKHNESEMFDKKQQYKIYREDLLYKYLWPKWIKAIFLIKKIIKRENIEQIYVGQILPIGEACQFIKLPYTIFSHGMDITMPQKNKRKKTILKKIIKGAENLIVNSNFTKDELITLGAEEGKIKIISPCPDIKLLDKLDQIIIDQVKEKYSLKDKKVLLSVGRLVERKDFDKVIESLTQIPDELSNLIYVIVGGGPDKQELEHLVQQLDMRIKVVFTGKIKDQELSALYSLCDIFIMTPKQLPDGDVEGFGTVYLEANLFGKPVIATASGGIEDAVINDLNGVIIKKASINEISDAIIKLLNDDNFRLRLGEQGKKRVMQEFQWHKQVEKLK